MPLIKKLSKEAFSLNVTAMLTSTRLTNGGRRRSISVFAGRIADTGVDPVPIMAKGVDILKKLPKAELLWASPREVLNVVQA